MTAAEKAAQATLRAASTTEATLRTQLNERDALLSTLFSRLSALCGSDWASRHANSSSSSSSGSSGTALGKTILQAVKVIESLIAGFRQKCRGVERDLWKEYQVVENALESRTRRLERLESLVRGGIGEQSGLRTEVAKLRAENRLLKAEVNVRQNEIRRTNTFSSASTAANAAAASTAIAGAGGAAGGAGVAGGDGAGAGGDGGAEDGEKRWILRLRELEKRLKAEREARLLDRSMAKKKVEEARGEREELQRELERERGKDG